jgi:hypothetical protein
MDKPSCECAPRRNEPGFPYGWIQFCGPAAIEVASQLRMRKRLISPIPHDRRPFDGDGLDLANLGMVEITSEDEAYPIECALQLGERRGWRAAEPGPQIIRLLFDQPQRLKTCLVGFRGSRKPTHTRVRPEMVAGLRAFVPRNCSPTMEFRSTGDSAEN